jgi:cysteine-rich repeat protein
MRSLAVLGLCAAFLGAACGDDDGGGDADASVPRCGDGVVGGDEQCDDGNDSDTDACRSDCRLACGDGEVAASEACDTGIAAGMPGACPASCDDAVACTTDQLTGSGCQAQCVHGAIGAFIPGDGCCPQGADINDDADCPVGCGNGVVEAGETCDTGIAAGMPGACVLSCDDDIACTTDMLVVPAGCQNQCMHAEVTTSVDGDGCCPAQATSMTDADCSVTCGNGAVEAGETCDTAILIGNPGACPATCNDSDPCTVDLTVSEGTCQKACGHNVKTTPQDGDSCCPVTANANNDTDCAPECGNGVIEAGEECDDGGVAVNDGCDDACLREPTAFRVVHMEVRDPHVLYDQNCADINETVNMLINDAIGQDQDVPADGHLDMNVVVLFRPLDQAVMMTPLDVDLGASCTVPSMPGGLPVCSSNGTMVAESMGTNLVSGTCLEPAPGTTNPGYAPPTVSPGAPCFVSEAESLDIDFQSFVVHLDDAKIAATYVGLPATDLVDGLIAGFISEAQADATILPADLPLVGGKPLSALLAGGGVCPMGPGADDRDMGPGGQLGWYFYINFTAQRVPYAKL